MNIEYNFVKKEQFIIFFNENRNRIFFNEFDFDISAIIGVSDKEKLQKNRLPFQDIEKYFLLAECEGKIIGWSAGHQLSASEFFMGNSAVLPEYRRQGVYTQMLNIVVKLLAEKGYLKISSKHKMSNNAILISKLKYGFVITGFDVSAQFGCLLNLTFFTKPEIKELLDVRIGSKKIEEKHLKLIE